MDTATAAPPCCRKRTPVRKGQPGEHAAFFRTWLIKASSHCGALRQRAMLQKCAIDFTSLCALWRARMHTSIWHSINDDKVLNVPWRPAIPSDGTAVYISCKRMVEAASVCGAGIVTRRLVENASCWCVGCGDDDVIVMRLLLDDGSVEVVESTDGGFCFRQQVSGKLTMDGGGWGNICDIGLRVVCTVEALTQAGAGLLHADCIYIMLRSAAWVLKRNSAMQRMRTELLECGNNAACLEFQLGVASEAGLGVGGQSRPGVAPHMEARDTCTALGLLASIEADAAVLFAPAPAALKLDARGLQSLGKRKRARSQIEKA